MFNFQELINKQLQDILYQRSHVDAKLNAVSKLFTRLELIQKDAQEISNTINKTAQLSDSVTIKIRQLDIARVSYFFIKTECWL